MVSFFEARGEAVDGIVAGRESVAAAKNFNYRRVKCRGCLAPLRPPLPRTARDSQEVKDHAGEQLCTDCYPKYSRRVRKGDAHA